MATRLQVLLQDDEFAEIRGAAAAQRMTVAEWVRQTLRAARRDEPSGDARKKLLAIRQAWLSEYPTADIQQMLAEIEGGYLGNQEE